MKYGRIDAAAHKVSLFEAKTFYDAEMVCDLYPMHTDHGVIAKYPRIGGIGIVVAEYSLFEPPLNAHYFAIHDRVYSGNGLVYAFGDKGQTVDFDDAELVPVRWFGSAQDVERAIGKGEVIRPAIVINGQVKWEWPAPKPNLEQILAGV